MSLIPLFNGRKNHPRRVQNSPPTTIITPQSQKNHDRSDSYDPTTTIMHQFKTNRSDEQDLYNYPPPTTNQDLHNLFNQLSTTRINRQSQTSQGQKDPYDPSHKFYLETPRSLIAPSLSFPHVTPFLAQFEYNVTPEAYVFRANLHGYKKEEVKVQVEDGRVLKISGEKKIVEKEYDNWHRFQKKIVEKAYDNWHRFQKTNGKFSTVFNLPEDARVDKVISTMENEVLIVTIPK
ncbi:hypothetical protein R3W88_027526 [Solanum pinnatisectum]|uniref:SHSP domain-containing protein n=1 Tax=Solanum pinnatisectum TaxID=50273 RepID=A0AAV9LGA2_9SOLN|nr:hypothetical protein R3W88_027526 [Solanum pinnatisectum]